MTTKAEYQHLEAIKSMRCLLVKSGQCMGAVQAHHVTDGGRRLGHFFTLPLCWAHHQAQSPLALGDAVHKGTKLFEQRYGKQEDLVIEVNKKCPCPACQANRNQQETDHVCLPTN